MLKIVKPLILLLTVVTLTACDNFPETPEEQKIFLEEAGEQVAHFYFKDNDHTKLFMKGVIYGYTHRDLTNVLERNPAIKTIVMVEVPGSVDDEVNLKASQEIRKRNIATYIPEGGWVASGGTDMFLAGTIRTAHKTAKLGVHSWGDDRGVATDYPKDHDSHQKYLSYYQQMMIPEAFYWYTLHAAPAEDIHWMTAEEIKRYNVFTE